MAIFCEGRRKERQSRWSRKVKMTITVKVKNAMKKEPSQEVVRLPKMLVNWKVEPFSRIETTTAWTKKKPKGQQAPILFQLANIKINKCHRSSSFSPSLASVLYSAAIGQVTSLATVGFCFIFLLLPPSADWLLSKYYVDDASQYYILKKRSEEKAIGGISFDVL